MRRLFKEGFILAATAVAGLYLLNPTAGFLEFIPDALPLVGNLDEIAATAILLNTLRYYGFDLTSLWSRDKAKNDQQPPSAPQSFSQYTQQQQEYQQHLREEQERAKRR